MFLRGGGVLFFLVCKKIAFPQQAIFFHLEGVRGSKGLYLSFSLCFSLRLVALFDSWPSRFTWKLKKIAGVDVTTVANKQTNKKTLEMDTAWPIINAVSVFRRFSTRYFGICQFFLRCCGIGWPLMSPSWRGIPDGTYLTVSEGAKVLFKFNAIKVWILYNFDLKDHLKSIEEKSNQVRLGDESVQRVKVNLHVRIKLATEFAHESPFILNILK